MATQSEAAVRHLATTHPYDAHDAGRTSLRDGAEVAEELTVELRDRTETAGIEVIEARITHLAYAPEIAQAMLVRQQAAQVVAARTQIVEGAVGMVGLALNRLTAEGMVELDSIARRRGADCLRSTGITAAGRPAAPRPAGAISSRSSEVHGPKWFMGDEDRRPRKQLSA